MSKWIEQIQKDVGGKFGKAVQFGDSSDKSGTPTLTMEVDADHLIDVAAYLKMYKDCSFRFLECLTAIDYPKVLPTPPPDIEPFRPATTLAKKEGLDTVPPVGRSAPLDPPRLDRHHVPHSLNELEEIKRKWPDMKTAMLPKVAPPAEKPAEEKKPEEKKEQPAEEKKEEAKQPDKEPPDTKGPVSPPSTEAKMVVRKKSPKKVAKQGKTVVKKDTQAEQKPEEKKEEKEEKTEAPQKPAEAPKPAAPAPAGPPKFDLNKITVVYVLYSMETKVRVVLRCDVNRDKPEIESVTPLWRGADWFEREVYDLYGVTFKHHPDLRRLFMDYPEFPGGYPLRKDYERPGFMVRLPIVR